MDGWTALGSCAGSGMGLCLQPGDALSRKAFWSWSWVLLGAGTGAPLSTSGSAVGCCPALVLAPPPCPRPPWAGEAPRGACFPPDSLHGVDSIHRVRVTEPVAHRGSIGTSPRASLYSMRFTPSFCAWCLHGAARLFPGLATAACNCSSSQTSVSLPQGWGWGCLGNAAGVVCLVVCSRNVGQTVKFFSPLVK